MLRLAKRWFKKITFYEFYMILVTGVYVIWRIKVFLARMY